MHRILGVGYSWREHGNQFMKFACCFELTAEYVGANNNNDSERPQTDDALLGSRTQRWWRQCYSESSCYHTIHTSCRCSILKNSTSMGRAFCCENPSLWQSWIIFLSPVSVNLIWLINMLFATTCKFSSALIRLGTAGPFLACCWVWQFHVCHAQQQATQSKF